MQVILFNSDPVYSGLEIPGLQFIDKIADGFV